MCRYFRQSQKEIQKPVVSRLSSIRTTTNWNSTKKRSKVSTSTPWNLILKFPRTLVLYEMLFSSQSRIKSERSSSSSSHGEPTCTVYASVVIFLPMSLSMMVPNTKSWSNGSNWWSPQTKITWTFWRSSSTAWWDLWGLNRLVPKCSIQPKLIPWMLTVWKCGQVSTPEWLWRSEVLYSASM